jgi:hypothetical protein
MDITTFWNIIAEARAHAGLDEPFDQALIGNLASRGRQDILDFQERFSELRTALYRWDLWGAAYLIGGGCSDDSFIDFRAGLIAQGHDWYDRAMVAPDDLADHPAVASAAEEPRDIPLFYEGVNYAAPKAFERVAGDRAAFYAEWNRRRGSRNSDGDISDMGEAFDFDDTAQMRQHLPRLSAVCLTDGYSPAS